MNELVWKFLFSHALMRKEEVKKGSERWKSEEKGSIKRSDMRG